MYFYIVLFLYFFVMTRISLFTQTQNLQAIIKNNPNPQKIPQNEKQESTHISHIYQEFIDCIKEHNHHYYNLSDSVISDQEYDELFAYLKKIEEIFPHLISSTSPTQSLQDQLEVQTAFKKAKHIFPMISLENSYSQNDIVEWIERAERGLSKSPHLLKTDLPLNPENRPLSPDKSGQLPSKGSLLASVPHRRGKWKGGLMWEPALSEDRVPAKQGVGSDVQEDKQEVTFLLEPKFDGISIEVIYENWKFVQAITRGDGIQWEDVTENAKTITSIPKTLKNTDTVPWDVLKWKISFRGEILISKTKLNEINQEREAQGLKIYANTRNLASGSMKQLDPNITAQRQLIAYMYEAYGFENTHNLYTLQDFWFNQDLVKLSLFQDQTYTQKDILEKVAYFSDPAQQKLIHDCDIEFDGLVIKIKDAQQRKILGSTAHHPRRAIAYKFPAQQVATQITSVDFQVGRTGIITPVANLQPVQLSGATLSRVSLHNFDFIAEKDIHQNDWVRLQRSGEVIPYIVGVITDRRDTVPQSQTDLPLNLENRPFSPAKRDSSPPRGALKKVCEKPPLGGEGDHEVVEGLILPPTHCPSCKTSLSHEEMHYFCRNPQCPAQLEQRVIWFVSKNAMNIEGIGESIAKILVEQKIVTNIFDIYKLLEPETLFIVRRFPWFAEKKISEIQKQLNKSKNIPLWRLINALWIGGIGKKIAQDIQNYLENLPDYENTWEYIAKQLQDRELVANIYGIGEKIIDNIVDFFQTQAEMLTKITELKFEFTDPPLTRKAVWNKGGNGGIWIPWKPSENFSFSITWTFPISRPQITEKLTSLGYEFHASPKKSTNIMLIWEKAGSKQAKAEELGLEILNTWEQITAKFPALRELEISKENSKKEWPEQRGLF